MEEKRIFPSCVLNNFFLKSIFLNLTRITLALAVLTSCTPPSSIPMSLLAHEDYSAEAQYWSRGSLTLLSSLSKSHVAVSAAILAPQAGNELDVTVFVLNSSGVRYDVGEDNIKVNIFYFGSVDIDTNSDCYSNSLAIDSSPKLIRKAVANEDLVLSPTISSREYMLTKEREHHTEHILLAVAAGITASAYDSDVAQAITLEVAGNRAEIKEQQLNDLLAGLSKGLFQRHTLWPGKSYMGIVKAPIADTYEYHFSGTREFLPTPRLVQVCASFGNDQHTFLFAIDEDIQ